MIKVKVFRLSSGYRKYDNSYIPVADYAYNVYFLGFLIHSLTVTDVENSKAEKMFNRKIENETNRPI